MIFAINGGAFDLAGQLANFISDSNSLLITNGANISSFGRIYISPVGAISIAPAFNEGMSLGGAVSLSAGSQLVRDAGGASEVRISSAANAALQATTAVVSTKLRVPQSTKANNSPGVAGEIAVDTDYIYVCTASNTWKRVTLSTY